MPETGDTLSAVHFLSMAAAKLPVPETTALVASGTNFTTANSLSGGITRTELKQIIIMFLMCFCFPTLQRCSNTAYQWRYKRCKHFCLPTLLEKFYE
jgi:hypothetical protein